MLETINYLNNNQDLCFLLVLFYFYFVRESSRFFGMIRRRFLFSSLISVLKLYIQELFRRDDQLFIRQEQSATRENYYMSGAF